MARSSPKTTEKVNKLKESVRYAFDELLGGIARPLFIGVLLGGMITYFVPADFLEQYIGEGIWSYLIMLAVGIPLYVCASGSIPLAAALLAKGISPGAALVFLIAGPATNIATVSVISDMLGKKTLFIYLATLIFGSLAAGYGTDIIFAGHSFWAPIATAAHEHGEHGISWFEILTGVGLGLAILYHAVMGASIRIKRLGKPVDGALIWEVPGMT